MTPLRGHVTAPTVRELSGESLELARSADTFLVGEGSDRERVHAMLDTISKARTEDPGPVTLTITAEVPPDAVYFVSSGHIVLVLDLKA